MSYDCVLAMSTAKDFLEWHSYDQLTEMLYEMINTRDQSGCLSLVLIDFKSTCGKS